VEPNSEQGKSKNKTQEPFFNNVAVPPQNQLLGSGEVVKRRKVEASTVLGLMESISP
jgi:hypothetical protein